MPICIAGMHRSGTSMITRLLNLCGLYLGATTELSATAPDNEAGFWENLYFTKLNEEALTRLGGGWDLPATLTEGWEQDAEMSPLRDEATELVRQFSSYEVWGWKDPRNSIMLPFWQRLIPDLKVVICLRNPLEVAKSLQMRNNSSLAFGLNLWLAYNQRLLSCTRPDERVMTHYNAYFYNPEAELRRLLSLLQIGAPAELVKESCSTISVPLRHSWITTQELLVNRI